MAIPEYEANSAESSRSWPSSQPSSSKRKRASDGSSRKNAIDLADDCGGAPTSSPTKKRKSQPKNDEEKRMRVHRMRAPQSFLQVKARALTQKMFVIDRTRKGTEECPEELVDIAGTTGNIYTVHIKQTPTCTCPHAIKGNMCKHHAYVMVRVLKVPEPLQYQLALLKSELRDIFSRAPPIPSPESQTDDGKRKPLEDDCPICCEEFQPDKEEIVYCKGACGNNIHKGCFEQWASAKKGIDGGVTCPFCRTPWVGDEESLKQIAKTGKVNADGYVNVASELGLTGRRDYSTYHSFWVRDQRRNGIEVRDIYFDDDY